jgi:predicted metal-dependent enzyme (double-stranded beta helix superfamily)
MKSESVKLDSFERYIEAVREVWGDGADPTLPDKVKTIMREMLTTADRDEPWLADMIAEGKVAKELYHDPDYGFIQMGHVQPRGHTNPPHDHGPCWVVYGAFSGRTEIVLYRHAGVDEKSGRAILEKRDVHQLTPGVVHPYVPGDIHSVVAVEGPAVVFRFLSADLNRVKRAYYDLDKNAVVRG